MANVIETINQRKDERGISLAELSRRTSIEYDALRTSLEGTRNLRAPEFVNLCKELQLEIGDFEEVPV